MFKAHHHKTVQEKLRCGHCNSGRPDLSQIKPPQKWTRAEALAIAKTLRLKANDVEKKLASHILGELSHYCEQTGCYTEVYEMLAETRKRLKVDALASTAGDNDADFDSILDGDGTRLQYETDHFIIDYTVDGGALDQVQDPTSDTVVDVTLADGTVIGTTTSGDGVPDFVKMLGIWLEYYLQQYVAYGFNDPTSDGAGGINKLDVTIRTGGSGTSQGDPIGIENILASTVGLAGKYDAADGGLGVTPGHELFHQVQYTYNDSSGIDLLRMCKEGTARWAEDSVNDAYNRYNLETPDYLNDTTRSLVSYDLRYETVILWKYLSEQKGATLAEPQRGVDALLLLWQNLVGAANDTECITAIDNTVQTLDATSSIYDLFAKFAVAIYLKDLGNPYIDATYDFLEDEDPRIPGGQVYGTLVPFDTQNLNGLSGDYTHAATSNGWGLQHYIFNLDTTVQSVKVTIIADAAFANAFYRVLEIRSGATTVHEGSGASYTVDLLNDITDLATARIDQVVVIVGAYETGGDYDLTVSVNDCVPSVMLVIDHSGSMASQGKMTAAIDAATLFVDLAEANGVPGLGAVGFSTTAAVLTNSSLEELTSAHADEVRDAIGGLSPTNMTSIGDGLQKAWDELDGDPVAATREVIVLLTDGMENTAPMIDDVDDMLVTNSIRVYPIGLGADYGIEPEKLEDLALLTGGDYRMTSDPAILEEFYLQILADNLCADMDGDGDTDTDTPESSADGDALGIRENSALLQEHLHLAGGTKLPGGKQIHAVSSDIRLNVVLTWENGSDDADLVVVTPNRLVLSVSNYHTFRGVRYRRGSKYAFFTIDLPLAGNQEGTWYGYPVNLRSGGKVRAFLVSGLDLEANTTEEILYTGNSIDFTARISDRGRPVAGLKVTVISDQPLYSYGNVMANDFQYPVAPSVSGDPVPDTHAKMNALIRQEGVSLLPREVNTFILKEDVSVGLGIYTNALFHAANPGSYHFTIKVNGATPDGDYFIRYFSFTKVVRTQLDSQSSTFILTPVVQALNQYTLNFTPIDKLGNLMGPGYGNLIKVTARNAKVLAPVKDLNNGTYSVPLVLDPDKVMTATISIAVKDQVIAVPKQVLLSALVPAGRLDPLLEDSRHKWVFGLSILALVIAIVALILALV